MVENEFEYIEYLVQSDLEMLVHYYRSTLSDHEANDYISQMIIKDLMKK